MGRGKPNGMEWVLGIPGRRLGLLPWTAALECCLGLLPWTAALECCHAACV